ncbi:MAG: lipocalin-like domain-containing protein, partial [Gemmatimonadaceae bacterium]
MFETTIMRWTLAALVALGGCTAPSTDREDTSAGVRQEQLVGAWRLAWLDLPGPDGKIQRSSDAKGSLIYTTEGVVSVQVMFAQAQPAAPNAPVQYAQDGYEASFGRYVVDEAARTVTHHYEGSLVRTLLSQDLPRRYRFSEGRLILTSTRADEQWLAAWER